MLAISGNDVEEVLNGVGDVSDEVTDGGGLSDDAANGASEGGKTEAREETSNGGGELEEELLGVGTGNTEGLTDLRGNVGDNLTTLEVLAEGSNNGTNGDTDSGETKTRDETSDGGRERDEESTNISTDNSDKVVNNGAETSDETTETGGRGNNGTERNTEAGETKAGDEGSDLRRELDEEGGDIGADNGQDVVKLGAKVLNDVTVLGSGAAGGSGGRAVGSRAGGTLAEVANLGHNGELVEVELLDDVANLQGLNETTDSVGGGSESRAGQSGDGSNERGLHFELGCIETVKSDCSLFKERLK